MKYWALTIMILMLPGTLFAELASSTNYQLDRDSINVGGAYSSSATYTLEDTAGERGTGHLTGTNYDTHAGYQQRDIATVVSSTPTPSGGGPGGGRVIDLDNPPANVADFTATYDDEGNVIDLEWSLPPDDDIDKVVIVRSFDFFPEEIDEGEVVFEGIGDFALDIKIIADSLYYYTLFVIDEQGQSSSGVVADEYIPDGEIDEDGELIELPGDDADDEATDPFLRLPTSPDYFDFLGELALVIRQGDTIVRLSDGDRILLDGTRELEFYIAYEDLPEVLKTIGISLKHPRDNTKIFSFLLKADDETESYRARVAPLLEGGEYEIAIHIIDHENNRLQSISGLLTVSQAGGLISFNTLVFIDNLAVFGGIMGILSGLVGGILRMTNVRTLKALWLLLRYWLDKVLLAFGLIARRRRWGVVYDANSKQGLALAEVRLLQGGQVVASTVTGEDGVYGFRVDPGSYEIEVYKDDYELSAISSFETNGEHTGLYGDVHQGGTVVVGYVSDPQVSIPMYKAAIGVEESSGKPVARVVRSLTRFVPGILFVLGFMLSILALLISLSAWNVIVIALYILISVWIIGSFFNGKRVKVIDANSGEPLSFMLVRVFLTGLNKEVARLMSDASGNLDLKLAPGSYYVTAASEQVDGSFKEDYRSDGLSVAPGEKSTEIKLDKKKDV